MSDPTAVAAYERFAELGAVLDLARFAPAPPAAQALVLAMRAFADRHHQLLVALNPGVDVSEYFHICIDPDVDTGTRVLEGDEISFAELLGDGYDIEADEVRLFRYSGSGRSSSLAGGLAHALLDPPYGLRGDGHPWGKFGSPEYAARESAWLQTLMRRFAKDVLGVEELRETSHLRIHRWPTDWSNYFDAGREWWGAFAWTVEDVHAGWTTVICASTTD